MFAEAVELHRNGRVGEAEALYRRILSAVADHPLVLLHLGLALHAQGKFAEMEAASRRCVAVRPDISQAHGNLGVALQGLGRPDEAILAFGQAVAVQPDNVEAQYNLANALKATGRFDEAAAAYRRAIEVKPDLAEAHANLGATLLEQGKFAEAVDACRHASGIRPNLAEAHYNLGLALKGLDRLDEAVDAYRRAVAVNPGYALAHNNLGVALKDLGRIDEAVAAFRLAVAANPDHAEAHSALLFCLCHLDSISPAALAAEHRAFGLRFEAPLKAGWIAHDNPREPRRRLRIGYVSADLYGHVVASFIEPVWAAMDRQQFDIVVYANTTRRDAVTARLEALAHLWREVAPLSDAALAERIRADRIDILVDLAGHTTGNRLPVFARKPAPVQVSMIGYPNTTGLSAIDYYIADEFFPLSPGKGALFTEHLIGLAAGIFRPSAAAPPVNRLPALARGEFTFGSFSRLAKISEASIRLWCRVLSEAPGSRLVLGAVPDNGARRDLAERLARYGVAESRLTFLDIAPVDVYLARYHAVDLILDSFPYSGSTTSNDAAWMGVPTLTLAGDAYQSWGSAICLCRVGLADFVVEREDDFVAKAVEWTRRLDDLAAIRGQLRARVLASPHTDFIKGAREVRIAFRRMWETWCSGLPPAAFNLDPNQT